MTMKAEKSKWIYTFAEMCAETDDVRRLKPKELGSFDT